MEYGLIMLMLVSGAVVYSWRKALVEIIYYGLSACLTIGLWALMYNLLGFGGLVLMIIAAVVWVNIRKHDASSILYRA